MKKLFLSIALIATLSAFTGCTERKVDNTRFIIDRFEGDFAIVEYDDNTMFDIPRAMIPDGAKEGDVINITINSAETEQRKEAAADRFAALTEVTQ